MIKICIVTAYRPGSIKVLLPALKAQVLKDGEEISITVINGTPDSFSTINDEYLALNLLHENVSFIKTQGGPANGRSIAREQCTASDTLILLDDDTIPSTDHTIADLLAFLRNNELDVASAVWNCSKNPSREYGTILHEVAGVITREEIRYEGIHDVHMPLMSCAIRGAALPLLSFDANIPFYGDILDIGMSILRNKLRCSYNSAIVFNHLNIKNHKDANFKRVHSYQYIAEKWKVSILHGGTLYSDLPSVGSANDILQFQGSSYHNIFIVEFNRYHFETILPVIEVAHRHFDHVFVLTLADNLGYFDGCPYANVKHLGMAGVQAIINFLRKYAKPTDSIFLNSAGRVRRDVENVEEYYPEYVKCVLELNVFASDKIFAIYHDLSFNQKFREQFPHKTLSIQPLAARLGKCALFLPISKKISRTVAMVTARPLQFVLPGIIDPARRNYEEILHAFVEVARRTDRPFVLNVLGPCPKNQKDYYDTLLKIIESSNRREYFNISEPTTCKISLKVFESVLERSHFVVFGLDHNNEKHKKYISSKSSGTLALSLSYQLVPVIDKHFSTAYGINDFSISYNSMDDLVQSVVRVLEIDGELLSSIYARMDSFRESILLRNAALFD